jgi:hypothetical protein
MHPLKYLARKLSKGDPAATLDRLFESKHVKDIRVAATCALIAVLALAVFGLWVSHEGEIIQRYAAQHPQESGSGTATAQQRASEQTASDRAVSENTTGEQAAPGKKSFGGAQKWMWLKALVGLLPYLAPVFAAFAAICAWAYKAAGTRLGVVDLFACEISTLCRVATVLDVVHRLIERVQGPSPVRKPGASAASPSATRPFVSQEDYFPVFSSNNSDLEPLGARVVINITAFYTYMKALRDSMRVLAAIPQPGDNDEHANSGPWHQTARDVIYLWFLGLESARRSIQDLIEFEPEKAERMIVILISELEAYHFLCSRFVDSNDVHYGRIRLRSTDYHQLVPALIKQVGAGSMAEQAVPGKTPDWLPAQLLLPALGRRYDAICEQEKTESTHGTGGEATRGVAA